MDSSLFVLRHRGNLASQWSEYSLDAKCAVLFRFASIGLSTEETHIMEINTRRSFFGKIAAMAALVTGAPKLFSQQTSPAAPPPPPGAPMAAPGDDRAHRAASHTHD